MNTFSLVTAALADTEDDESKAGLDLATVQTGRVLHAVQVVVDALTPPDGGRFVVGFSDISTAQTSLGERRITISSKPLRDKTLSLVEKAVVMATFAAHEIGHTLVTAPRRDLIKQHNPISGYHTVTNLADDIILEPFMVDRYPILKDAFVFTGLWVLRNTAKTLPKTFRLTADLTTADRFNILLNATRYGDIAEIIWADGATLDERDWSRTWAERLIDLRLTDHGGFIALCDEAWVRIRSVADVDDDEVDPDDDIPQPDDESGDDDGPGGESEDEDADEDESDDDESDDDEGEPNPGGDEESDEEPDANDQPTDWDDDTDEDGDEPNDDGESDEDADDDESDEDGESEDEGDDDGEDESEGTDEDGETLEGADESDENGDPKDGDTDPDDDEGDPVDADPDRLRDENDFNEREVDQTTHEQAERDPRDWEAQFEEDRVRKYANTTVTAFGAHGKMSTEWS